MRGHVPKATASQYTFYSLKGVCDDGVIERYFSFFAELFGQS